MFIQVIRGKTADAEGLSRQMERWDQDLRPGAEGFLGSTSGVTDDGTFIAVARFRDEAAARANAGRAEQTAWWNETAKFFEGEPSFVDTTDVDLLGSGGSDAAGFVQVMVGRVRDRDRFRDLMRGLEPALTGFRPDVVGGVTAWDGDRFVDATYFTSEAEARENEAKEPPADVAPAFEEWRSLIEEIEYLDLREPRLTS